MKILNASNFVLSALGAGTIDASKVTAPLDRAMLAELADVVGKATSAFEQFDYTAALEATERFFWSFCDDHVELVKERAYGKQGEEAAESAKNALALALSIQLRLFAPFLPFVTDEVWSWWNDGSIHVTPWPHADELAAAARGGDRAVVASVAEAISAVRKVKSEAKVSMRAEISSATFHGSAKDLERVRQAESDLRAAGRIAEITYAPVSEAAYIEVDATLAPVVAAD
jgi:valyl-tRNA synthetase